MQCGLRCGLGQRTAQPPQKWTEKVGELVIIIFPGLHFLKGHSLIPPQHQQNPMANGSSPRTCFVCGRLKLPWESSKSHGLSIIHYVLGSKTTHPCASIITPPASLRVGAMLPASEGALAHAMEALHRAAACWIELWDSTGGTKWGSNMWQIEPYSFSFCFSVDIIGKL